MSIDNNPPAFPHHFTQDSIGDCSGMDLRDYFAAKAMQGLLAQSQGTAFRSPKEHAAAYAYSMADAMLKARATPPHQGDTRHE